MARPRAPSEKLRVAAENRKARHDYFLEELFEAGIMLTGTEVKSLRAGQATIAESYAEVAGGEAWLVNATIPEWSHGNRFNHEPRRPRKLLLHAREIDRLQGAVARSEKTLSNAGFRSKAPPEVVAREEARLAELKEQLARLEAQLALLA